MPCEQAFSLLLTLRASVARGQQKRVKTVNVAACGQNIGVYHDVAARSGLNIRTVKRVNERGHLVAGVQLGTQSLTVRCVFAIAQFVGRGHHGIEHILARLALRIGAKDVQPMRDQRFFEFVKLARQLFDGAVFQINRVALIRDQLSQIFAFRVILADAPALNACLKLGQILVEPGLRQWRREVADQRCGRTALGQHAFRRVVCSVEIVVRKIADQALWPAFIGQTGLLAGHEFQRAMRAEVQHAVGCEVFANIAVKGAERVGRSKTAFEQKAHRIAFIAKAGLNADEDIAEMFAQDLNMTAIALRFSGRWAPGGFDIFQIGLARDMLVSGHAVSDIDIRAVLRGIAFQQVAAHGLKALRHFDAVAFLAQPLESGVQRFVHRHEGCGSRSASVGREVEKDNRELARRAV